MTIRRLASFDRDYPALPAHIRKKLDRVLVYLTQDIRHPGIKARKMVNHPDIWEARVDEHYRLTFKFDQDILILRRVGTHEIYRNP